MTIPADRLLITVAPTGAESVKADVPALPTTLAELVETAERCEAAGAAMVHVHIRDDDHQPTLDPAGSQTRSRPFGERTSLVVQLSTGGSVHDPLEHRLRVLEAAPDSCSLTMGTVNFGDEVFLNPWPFVVDLYEASKAARGRAGVRAVRPWARCRVAPAPRRARAPVRGRVHCDLVMGVPGGMPGTAAALVAAVNALPEQTTSWSATGIGRTTLPVALAALSAGGHLRVGMEDTVTFSRGRPVAHNAELVERAATLADVAQRPAMTTADARDLLQTRTADVAA